MSSPLEAFELTPPGRGAVSVIALRGEGALERVRRLAPLARLAASRPALARLCVDGETLDEALVCVRDARTVELHVHASPPLVRRLLAELAPPPERAPERATDDGQRATGDGTRSEELAPEAAAARLLPHAPCEDGARVLLDQAEGALRAALTALVAASPAARGPLARALAERGRVCARLLVPSAVVIAGPVNAGKSTLFNVLLGAQRALTSDVPGTTRDQVLEPAQLGRYPVWLSDTAGARELASSRPDEALEQAGQALARAAMAGADVVLWLAPLAPGVRFGPVHAPTAGAAARVDLAGRADLCPELAAGEPYALAPLRDPAHACELVARVFRDALELPDEPWRPGGAVPFLAEQRAPLERLADDPGDRAALEALRELLERPPSAASAL